MAGDCAGFESYLRGSWWSVQIREERSSMFLVSYNADKEEEWAWVPWAQLRLSSRKADSWDCDLLRKGMDVSVQSKHPQSNSLNLEKEGVYDATIASTARAMHPPGQCSCKFGVHFLSVKVNVYMGGTLSDRIRLTDEPETLVTVSDIRILQKPAQIVSFQSVLEAHFDRMWIPLGRGCLDAYFLTETELSEANQRPGDACCADHSGPKRSRSDEILSPSPATVSTKSEERDFTCNSPDDDAAPPNEAPGATASRQSPGTPPEDECRISKKAPPTTTPEDQPKMPSTSRHADRSIPPSIRVKKECLSAEDHNHHDHSNGIMADDRATATQTKRRRGRPSIKELRSAKKKNEMEKKKRKTKYPIKDGDDDDNHNNNNNSVFAFRANSDSDPDDSDSDSDSEGEWKPYLKSVKRECEEWHGSPEDPKRRIPPNPYNIRTRERDAKDRNTRDRDTRNRDTGDRDTRDRASRDMGRAPQQFKSDAKPPITGKGRGRMNQKSNRGRGRYGKTRIDRGAKPDFFLYASREAGFSGSE